MNISVAGSNAAILAVIPAIISKLYKPSDIYRVTEILPAHGEGFFSEFLR